MFVKHQCPLRGKWIVDLWPIDRPYQQGSSIYIWPTFKPSEDLRGQNSRIGQTRFDYQRAKKTDMSKPAIYTHISLKWGQTVTRTWKKNLTVTKIWQKYQHKSYQFKTFYLIEITARIRIKSCKNTHRE